MDIALKIIGNTIKIVEIPLHFQQIDMAFTWREFVKEFNSL